MVRVRPKDQANKEMTTGEIDVKLAAKNALFTHRSGVIEAASGKNISIWADDMIVFCMVSELMSSKEPAKVVNKISTTFAAVSFSVAISSQNTRAADSTVAHSSSGIDVSCIFVPFTRKLASPPQYHHWR